MARTTNIIKSSVHFLVILCWTSLASASQENQPPHIVVILADDLGWNDVSFHGSDQIPTPNIDALAYNGVILNNHYVQPLCTPSRASFMTGKYPFHNGMQHLVLLEPEPRGLPLSEKLLPEYLKSIGYSTHIVGKWHLGFYRSEYTPTKRGFDSHYGYWNGLQDYYDHTVQATFNPEMIGYDFRRDLEVDWSAKGKYSTYLFAEEASNVILKHNKSVPMFLYLAHLAPHTGNMRNPFQAPDEEIAKFSHIADPERRIYAAMVSALDQSVGTVVTALRAKGMLDNSIILFMSDNGAPTYGIHSNRGSNYPFRGQKGSGWEGASRGVAAIWSPLLKKNNRVSHQMMHISDWLPTFWKAAGKDPKDLGNIDGINLWDALSNDSPSPRTKLVVNIDEISSYVSIRNGDWKYVNGSYDKNNLWVGDSGTRVFTPSLLAKNIMFSATGSALAGYITEKQVTEMQVNNGSKEFSLKLLKKEDIVNLRNEAIIKCKESENSTKISCDVSKEPCLFNIKDDPCESVNLAGVKPVILQGMQSLAEGYLKELVPASNLPEDLSSDPALHKGVWVNWKDEVTYVRSVYESFSPSAIAAFSVFLFFLFIGLLILICYVIKKSHWYKDTIKSKSFTRRKVRSQKGLSINVAYTKNREPIVLPIGIVADRVEMFEEQSINSQN